MKTEFAKRAVACNDWRWMAGMALIGGSKSDRLTYVYDLEKDEYVPVMEGGGSDNFPAWGWPSSGSGWLPDFEDPATVGCLLQLVHEAICLKLGHTEMSDMIQNMNISGFEGGFVEALVTALEGVSDVAPLEEQ